MVTAWEFLAKLQTWPLPRPKINTQGQAPCGQQDSMFLVALRHVDRGRVLQNGTHFATRLGVA